VILGCGRVGALLADRLDESGHSVAVIDQTERSFRRLGTAFSGDTVTGMGFDRQTMEKAGIERAHAFAAVSSGDNTNIIAARTAREVYGVEHVVARIYDPRRAEVYQRLGIPTVATVSWTAGQIMRRLLPLGAEEEYRDASGNICVAEVPYAEVWIGQDIQMIESAIGAKVGFITRDGTGFVPDVDSVLQQGDLLHLVMEVDRRDSIAAMLEAKEIRR
jgi:trk system potassium uptake protein TrkA